MNEGYQVIELPGFERLFGNPKCFDLAVFVLQWIADEANLQFAGKEPLVEVIKVEYLGHYPALGIRGRLSDDAEMSIIQMGKQFLLFKNLNDLLIYASNSGIYWRHRAVEILGE